MSDHEDKSHLFEVDPDHRSRGDEILERFRREAVFTDQFKIGTVFFLMTVAALIAVLPRLLGAKPVNFFLAFGIAACAMGPLTTLVTNSFFPVFSKRMRIYLSAGLLSLLAIGWFVLVAYSEGSNSSVASSLGILVGMWLVQGIAIWMLWRSLFRTRGKKKPRDDQFGQGNKST